MRKIKTALVSVSDKTGLPEFVKGLCALGVQVSLATSGTARLLHDSGINIGHVYDHADFAGILNGLLTTPAQREAEGPPLAWDATARGPRLDRRTVYSVDMVVMNLYASINLIAQRQPDLAAGTGVEDTEVDGPTLIRAAAKNHSHVAVVTDPARYGDVLEELRANDGALSTETRFNLAMAAFRHTAHYDTTIARYMAAIEGADERGTDRLTLEFVKERELAHGENPHQAGILYTEENVREACVGNAKLVSGPEPGYGGIVDLDMAMDVAKEFFAPAAILVKHGRPCGVGVAEQLSDTCGKALQGASGRADGCAFVLTEALDAATAERMAAAPTGPASLAAPGLAQDALAVLAERAAWFGRTAVFETPSLRPSTVDIRARDGRRITGGLLLQDRDAPGIDTSSWRTLTKASPTDEQMADLVLAWLCCKHARSSAAAVARDGALLALSSGRLSADDAVADTLRDTADRFRGAAMAADAGVFSLESLEYAVGAGVKAVVLPGDGECDGRLIQAANRQGISLLQASRRHFRY